MKAIKYSVTFSVERRKDKEGKPIIKNMPVRMQVTWQRRRVLMPTGLRVSLAEWNSGEYEKHPKLAGMRDAVEDVFERARLDGDTEVLADTLKQYLRGETPISRRRGIIDYIDEVFIPEQRRQVGLKKIRPLTVKKYITLSNHIDGFLLHKSNKNKTKGAPDGAEGIKGGPGSKKKEKIGLDVCMSEINTKWLEDLSEYFMEKCGHFNPTISKAFKNLRQVLRSAEKEGYRVNTAYNEFTFGEGKPRYIVHLTWEELMQLNSAEMPNIYIERARDILLFACATGLRYEDLMLVSQRHIEGDFIKMHQSKTGDPVSIPLNFLSRGIIEKYRGQRDGGGLLPQLSNQKLNEGIKKAGKVAGIDAPVYVEKMQGITVIPVGTFPKYELLSSKTGRKTISSIMGYYGVSSKVIQSFTGHREEQVLNNHYRGVTDEERRREMGRVFDVSRAPMQVVKNTG